MEDDRDIKVSILCPVYNSAKYLRNCLDGLVGQKTNFKYEIIISDDASTDESADIIKKYKSKYKDIIKPIFQKDNQFSKGVNIMLDVLFPKAKGEYIALCDGDDYWIDEKKLQKQFDKMQSNKEYSLCVHNTIIHDLEGKQEDKLFNNWENNYILNEEDVFMGWKVHTSSYFLRRESLNMPENFKNYWIEDYVKLTTAFHYGKIIYLNDVMSQYNINNPKSVTKMMDDQIDRQDERMYYLEEFNKFSNGRFENTIKEKIAQIEIRSLVAKLKRVKDKEQYKGYKQKINNNKYFKSYIKNLEFKEKIKFLIRYFSFFNCKLLNTRQERREKNK